MMSHFDPEHSDEATAYTRRSASHESARPEFPNLPSRAELHGRSERRRVAPAHSHTSHASGGEGGRFDGGGARAIDLPPYAWLAAVIGALLMVGLVAGLWFARGGTEDASPNGVTQSSLVQQSAAAQSGSLQSGEQVASVFDLIKVSGRVGATPVLDLSAPLEIKGSKRHVYENGDGRVIADNAPVLVAITAFDGQSGAVLNPSGRARLLVGHADAATLGEDLLSSVRGHSEGSRIVVVRSLNPNGIAPGATSAVEIDVVDILPAIATGTIQQGANGNPLQVEMGDEGPAITHGPTVPSGLTTQLLLKGEGAQVNEEDNVVAQYIVMGWTDGIQRQSTWSTGVPELINLKDAMPGISQALIDQRVGSRIAVTVPPDLATGDDTLAVVIDILGTEPASDTANAPQSSGSAQSSQSASVTSAPR